MVVYWRFMSRNPLWVPRNRSRDIVISGWWSASIKPFKPVAIWNAAIKNAFIWWVCESSAYSVDYVKFTCHKSRYAHTNLTLRCHPVILSLKLASLGFGESHILLGGGGGASPPPPVISQTTAPISKIQTPFDSSAREISKHGLKFDQWWRHRSGQNRNGRLFGLVDIGAWIVSLTFVSIISCAWWP